MDRRKMLRGAAWIKVLLFLAASLFFHQEVIAHYDFDEKCREAYTDIVGLRFSHARFLLQDHQKSDPANLIPVYLANYIDFLTLIIGEEKAEYNRLKTMKSARIDDLERGDETSPLHRFCLGEVHLQWAVVRLKFGDYTAAALDIRKAYALFSENDKLFPDFLVNKMGLGVVHVIAGIVPDNYKWISSLIGMTGSTEAGINEIKQVALYRGADPLVKIYRTQATFYLAFLTLNLQKNKKDALSLLNELEVQQLYENVRPSPLVVFAKASVLMRNGLNDKALIVLQQRDSTPGIFPFYYLDYLEGIARLNKLDLHSATNFTRFITNFKGENYIRAAWQKLAWIALLKGDSSDYHRVISNIATQGNVKVDEDRQAISELTDGVTPNIYLLKSRLLFDGGYYSPALNQLLNHPVNTIVRSKREFIEYSYRLGRIYGESGNIAKALIHYQQTLDRGRHEKWYFATAAAYQMGLIYENHKEFKKAESAYQLCLSLDPDEYKNSLHQKAKAGLNRLKKTGLKSETNGG